VQCRHVDLDGRVGIEAAAHVVGAGTGEHAVRRTALGGEREQRLDLRNRNALRRLCMAWYGDECAEHDRGERLATPWDGKGGSDEGHGPK